MSRRDNLPPKVKKILDEADRRRKVETVELDKVDFDLPEVKDGAELAKSRGNVMMPWLAPFNLRERALSMADDADSDSDQGKVLTLRGCPRYVKVVFADFQEFAKNDGVAIPTGAGWSAALDDGLDRLSDHALVGLWKAAVSQAKRNANNLPLATRVRIHRIIEQPDFSMSDPVGAGRESLSFRCPQGTVRRLYEVLRAVYLPGRTSTVALPCIAAGLAHQPGVGDEASGYLDVAFQELVDTFAAATADLKTMMQGFTHPNEGNHDENV